MKHHTRSTCCTTRRFQRQRQKELATTPLLRPTTLLRLVVAVVIGTVGWSSSSSSLSGDPADKIHPHPRNDSATGTTTMMMIRGVDAGRVSPDPPERLGSSSSSSSESGSSSSSILGGLYSFSEEEREERILQALERIANLFSNTASDDGEREDITNTNNNSDEEDIASTTTAAAIAIANGLDQEKESESVGTAPYSSSPRRKPPTNTNSEHDSGLDKACLYQQQLQKQSYREEISVGQHQSAQMQQNSPDPKEKQSRFRVPFAPMPQQDPVWNNSTANSIVAQSAGATGTASAASVLQHDHRHADSKIKVFPKKKTKGNAPVSQQPVSSTLASITTPWVRQFLASCQSDVLLPVPKDYCSDNFNLSLLPPIIEKIANAAPPPSSLRCSSSRPFPLYRQALKLLLQDAPVPEHIPEPVERAATALYLLLHQRYALSPRGLDMLRRRFLLSTTTTTTTPHPLQGCRHRGGTVDPIFGRCPSTLCRGMPLLPIGESDEFQSGIEEAAAAEATTTTTTKYTMKDETPILDSLVQAANRRAKRYCACCRRVYYHWDSQVDGCAWGKSLCHLFLMVHGEEVFAEWNEHRVRLRLRHNENNNDNRLWMDQPPHEPTIFGFRLHPSAPQ